MKNGIWIFFMLLIFSCKLEGDKAKSNNETADTTALVSNEPKQEQHYHYYRIYKGKLIGLQDAPNSPIYGECELKENESKTTRKLYLKGTDTANEIGSSIDSSYYFLINKENKREGLPTNKVYILLKNNDLPVNSHVRNEIPQGLEGPKTKGSLGCFPKFIIKNGNLDFYMNSGKRYIQLPMAYHDHQNQIIETLEFRSFAISQENYNLINDQLKNVAGLQGGIDEGNENILKIYFPNGDHWKNISGDGN